MSESVRSRVLLVESDPEAAAAYGARLEQDGCEVAIARTGADGLHQAETWGPDLVITEAELPDMSGLALLDTLSERPAPGNRPVLVLSEQNDPVLVEKALDLGALDWLCKGQTTPAALSRFVRAWLWAVWALEPAELVRP